MPVPRRPALPAQRSAARSRRRLLAALAALILAPAPAAAASGVLVELFTSQGCSSCPPADALLHDLADRPDVVALSLHVDYWDYLGWRDVFARPAFTERQAAYRDAHDARSVWTPQMIVDGRSRLVGSRVDEVVAAIDVARAAPPVARLALARAEGGVEVALEAAPGAALPEGCVLWYVTFRDPPPVDVARGENAGRALAYANVVDGWMRLGGWDGAAPARLVAPAPEPGQGVAVILQHGPVGPVLAAASLEP